MTASAVVSQPDRATDDSCDTFAAAFGSLRSEIRADGLLRPRPEWYLRMIATTALLALLVAASMITVGSSWWQLALAVLAGVVTARMGFIGHGAGHQQIARSRTANRLVGLIHGNLLTGMSRAWWLGKHNKHHAHPNDVERDPDVGPGVIAWTTDQAERRRSRAARWFTRHQAGMFVPLLLLEGVNLKVASIRDLWSRPGMRTEKALIVAHYLVYVTFLFVVMSPWQALAFVGVHQAALGLHLGCAFAPNHKGMPMPGAGEKWGYLRQQVLTSRNVRGGPILDWLLGGLNYQIEHHLFPRMPRPNLRLAQPVVRRHCEAIGLPYTEESALRSYARAFGHLAHAGRGAV